MAKEEMQEETQGQNEEVKRKRVPVENDVGFVDVPDIPLPEEYEDREAIEDECNVAFNWAFVGAGQAGNRMVETFWKLGYRRVCAINVTNQDLAGINIPNDRKYVMEIGEGGAGKDPEKGKKAITEHYENVYDLMRRSFGNNFERIMICIGAGGGCVVEGTSIFVDKLGFVPIEKAWSEALKNEKNGVKAIYDAFSGHRILDVRSLRWYTYGVNTDTGATEKNLVEQIFMMDVASDNRKRVVLNNGAETVVSKQHPYFILGLDENGMPEVQEKQAQHLKLDDLVFTPEVSVQEYLSERDKDIAWMSGLVAGDGHFADPYQLDITSMDSEILEECQRIASKWFRNSKGEEPNTKIMPKENNKAKVLRIYSGECVREIAQYIGGIQTDKIETWIPTTRVQTNYAFGNVFIAGLFDADGYVERNLTGISIANQKACRVIAQMLSMRGVTFTYREKEPKKSHWKTMYALEVDENGRQSLAMLIGKYSHCLRKIGGYKTTPYKHGHVVEGLSFQYIQGILNILRITKSTSQRASNFTDEEGDIDITAWSCRGKNPRFNTVSRLLKWLNTRWEKMSQIDVTKLTCRELCKIAGLEKKRLAAMYTSFFADKVWRKNECSIEMRSKLENWALAHLNSVQFASVPKAIEILIRAAKSASNVVELSEANGEEQFYDLSVQNCHSYVASLSHSVCFVHNTGTGSVETLIQISHDIAQSFKVEKANDAPAVGALVSMPQTSEGVRVNANAFSILQKLFAMVGKDNRKLSGRSLSPLIIVDNERIQKIYPNIAVSDFWGMANTSISSLFHLFNHIAIQDSDYTTFDRADLKDILQSGVITFGATPIKKYSSATDISYAIRDNLKRNILVGSMDLRQAKIAGCIFVAHPSVLSEIPQEYLEHGFEMLSRMMGEKSVVHRGIYKGRKEGFVVYSILGELGKPEERMEEIAREAGIKLTK